MDAKTFRRWNSVVAAAVLAIATAVYLSTIEPTASFWDCGEFIASSYKLEVGHPPGNPVFQLIARLFAMVVPAQKAAMMVNSMSALCSAFTIFFLYLTIVFFAKRLFGRGRPVDPEAERTPGEAVAVFGSGAVGALVYCFSDTFWFSAVEGEVYAMSSLFTALVVWAMTKWYEAEDRNYSNRWIVLISFLMGLSIGVHLLNLLAIPMLVFLYYYKAREDRSYTAWEYVRIFAVSVALIALVLFLIVPYGIKSAAFTDRIFVNLFGLPYNTGAAFFVVALLSLCFWGLFRTLKKNKVFWNTALLCLTTILVGFSIFSVCVIRSCAKTPTNEYQPDNAYTLYRYLSREQYGSTPLLYGQYYGSPYDIVQGSYWAPLDGKYKKVPKPLDAKYDAEGKMLFPRMHSNDPKHIKFYQAYTGNRGTALEGTEYKKPTFRDNLTFFFDFQLGWMYWRYFMWNFVGRQNDTHAPVPDLFSGNWESGIGFLDEIRLADQSQAPEWVRENKGKNHYYFLPLLLGLLGLVFQFDKDRRGSWLVFLLFFMTGIAIVLYLNQAPFQVRERDYAYAGSFYAFSIWVGLGVAAVYSMIASSLSSKKAAAVSFVTCAACLSVPALMAAQNWDDHDRSNRRTAVEVAKNFLNSVGQDGILIVHGDNDTFPLWYAQEVEGFRTDVRICNTSLLGTDWHIDQMKYACNESAPLNLSIGKEQYLYGTNDWIPIVDNRGQALPIADVVAVFKHPEAKVATADGKKIDYWVSRKMIIPVNRENVLKSGILSEKFADEIPDSIVLEIPESKNSLTKPELFLLDFLSTYQWDRPLHMLDQGGELKIGLKDYLMSDGFSCRLVPIRNKVGALDLGRVDTDVLYENLMVKSDYSSLSREDYYADYQNCYTFLGSISLRHLFASSANAFITEGEYERAEAVLDKCQEALKPSQFPYDNSCLGWESNALFPIEMVKDYYTIDRPEKAQALARELVRELHQSVRFYISLYPETKDKFEYTCNLVTYLADEVRENGDKDFAQELEDGLSALLAETIGSE